MKKKKLQEKIEGELMELSKMEREMLKAVEDAARKVQKQRIKCEKLLNKMEEMK